MWRSSVEAGRNSNPEADGLMWGVGALEGEEILVDIGEEFGLAARRRLGARLPQIFPRLLPFTRSPVSGSESVEVRGSARIYRSKGLQELLDPFLVFSLVHQDSSEIEMGLPITGHALDRLPKLRHGFRQFALRLE